MLLRTLLAVLLLGTVPAFAQPVPIPDCTADVILHEALTLGVAYHCRSNQPLSFAPEGERARPFLSNFTAGRIEAVNGDHGSPEVAAALRAALSEHRRARGQRAQLRRLKKDVPGAVTLPYLFEPEFGLAEFERLSAELERKLAA